MTWEAYHREIIEAKEEYDRSIKPIIEILEHTQEKAWEKYLKRITQAKTILKEDSP